MSRALILKRVANNKKCVAIHDAETGEILADQLSCEIVNKPDEPLHAIVKIGLCGVNRIVGDDETATITNQATDNQSQAQE
ncbi:hypothetical protein [Acinetobacter guillouiae]|uniref:hypothetical protein n=1 Tax=Acinetobacter guillouiae TaxID=106649 RepID=UPI0028D4A48F|nr:hypothetical protein [Acinetobacter guillouiae]